MTRRIAIFIVFLFMSIASAAGCMGHARQYIFNPERSNVVRVVPVYIDYRFSGNDKIVISNALMAWNYAFNGQVRFELNYNVGGWDISQMDDVYLRGGIAIIKLSESSQDIIPTLDSDPYRAKKVLAWVNKIGGDRIHVLRDRMNETDLFYIMLHELGHIFGATHVDKDELMQPTYIKGGDACIDRNTARKAAEKFGINPDTMNWCK